MPTKIPAGSGRIGRGSSEMAGSLATMGPEQSGGLRAALGWFLFPIIPALLGGLYHKTINFSFVGEGPDPRDWGWAKWLVLAGPLLGYGFLAGATLGLPASEPGVRRRWRSRPSAWVAIGPWIGFLIWGALFFAAWGVRVAVLWAYPASQEWREPFPPGWEQTWAGWLAVRALIIFGAASLAYGWLFVARAALGRARRVGHLKASIRRGLLTATGFVASLFGTFWALTSAFRGYFFDPRVVPILLAAGSLALSAGCTSTVTYGEVRRRELFQAMLTAWLLGLAMAWRWWNRSRRGRR